MSGTGHMDTPRADVYAAIDGERKYQDERWVNDVNTHRHSPEEWLMYMEDYIAEAKHILSRDAWPKCNRDAMHIMRKVTAMGVAAMEQNGAFTRPGY